MRAVRWGVPLRTQRNLILSLSKDEDAEDQGSSYFDGFSMRTNVGPPYAVKSARQRNLILSLSKDEGTGIRVPHTSTGSA